MNSGLETDVLGEKLTDTTPHPVATVQFFDP
jgi:hypothetical protein